MRGDDGLRAGLVQLLCALTGLGLGLLLPRITAEPTVASTRVTESLVAVGFVIDHLAAASRRGARGRQLPGDLA